MKLILSLLIVLSLSVPAYASEPAETLQAWQQEGKERLFYVGAVVGAVRVLSMFATCQRQISPGMVVAVLNANHDPTWANLEFTTAVMAGMYRLGCTFGPPIGEAKAQRAY